MPRCCRPTAGPTPSSSCGTCCGPTRRPRCSASAPWAWTCASSRATTRTRWPRWPGRPASTRRAASSRDPSWRPWTSRASVSRPSGPRSSGASRRSSRSDSCAPSANAGHYVAMTGDGVNDVLSLKRSNLAIAMGSGSQATRGVADLILIDDGFAALASAIGEGQRILNGMQDILRVFLTRILSLGMLIVSALVIGLFPVDLRNASVITLFTVGVPTALLAVWARPGRQARESLQQTLARFVVPASGVASFLGLLVAAVRAHPRHRRRCGGPHPRGGRRGHRPYLGHGLPRRRRPPRARLRRAAAPDAGRHRTASPRTAGRRGWPSSSASPSWACSPSRPSVPSSTSSPWGHGRPSSCSWRSPAGPSSCGSPGAAASWTASWAWRRHPRLMPARCRGRHPRMARRPTEPARRRLRRYRTTTPPRRLASRRRCRAKEEPPDHGHAPHPARPRRRRGAQPRRRKCHPGRRCVRVARPHPERRCRGHHLAAPGATRGRPARARRGRRRGDAGHGRRRGRWRGWLQRLLQRLHARRQLPHVRRGHAPR